MNSPKRKTFNLALALTLGLGVCAPATAFAYPVLSTPTAVMATDLSVHLVDAARDGSSTVKIVKYKLGPNNGTTENTGTTASLPDGETLDGVTFTLKKVASINGTDITGIDYTKNADWETLHQLVDENGQPKGAVTYDAGDGTSMETAGGGVATFENLHFGVYEVSETATPAGVTPAERFYLTLPFATKTATDSVWSYDPVVYPKNSIDAIEKKVNDAEVRGIGQEWSYTLTSTLSRSTDRYVITDKLHEKVDLKAVTVQIGVEGQMTDLTVGEDYTLTPADLAAEVGGEDVRIEMTEAGRTKLAGAYKANPDSKMVSTFTVKNMNMAGKDDNVPVLNRAYLIPNSDPKWDTGTGDTPPGIPSNEVETRFGKLQVKKVAQEDNQVALAGATFKLFATEADAKAETNPLEFVDIQGNVVTEVVTDKSGIAVFDGIRVSDFENNAELDEANTDFYYLVETKAPDGRAKLAEPVKVKVTGAKTGDTIALTEQQIENMRTNLGFNLSATGSTGVYLLSGAAGLLVVGGVVLLVINRKNNKKEEK